MSKITRSLTIEEEVWNKAREKAGSRKLSSKIEEMLKDYTDYDEEEDGYQDTDILEKSGLSEKQKSAVRLLLREGKSQISLGEFTQLLREEGIYDRSDFIKKAVQRISKDDYGLFEKEGSKLVVQNIQCYCGSSSSPLVLDEGRCLECGTQLLDLEEEEDGLEVV